MQTPARPPRSRLTDFVIEELTSAPNVDSVKTTLILRVDKYQPGIPIA